MPKTEPATVSTTPPTTFVTNETTVNDKLTALASTVEKLAGAVQVMADNMPVAKTRSRAPVVKKMAQPKMKELPIPPAWEEVVHKILGSDFTLKVEAASHGNFSVHIIFPEHIDRRPGEQRDAQHPRDHSMCSPVRLSSPEDDLRIWCEKVAENIRLHPNYRDFTPKK